MALAVADRVKETSTTAGTGTLTLLGAVSGYQSFSVIGSGNTTYYCIVDDNTGQWEVGVGTYTSPNQLSRDTVLSSSSGGSAITFLGNIKQVFVTYPAERSVYENAAGSLVLSKVEATTGIITNLTSTSATITNLSLTSLTLDNLNIASANITTLTSTNATAASLTVSTGNLTFSSTGQRITGDMSNATIGNRLAFQNSVTNGNTVLGLLPNGTATTSAVQINNNSDTTAALGFGNLQVSTTEFQIAAAIRNAGTYLPMTFYTSGSERMRLTTAGDLGLGTTSPGARFEVSSASNQSALFKTSATGSYGAVQIFNTNTNGEASIGFRDNSDSDATSWVVGKSVGATDALGFYYGSTRMVIDTSGNVGIGTASPNRFVHLYSTDNWMNFQNASRSYLIGLGNTSNFTIYDNTGGTERLTVTSAGNVGIGTASPQRVLSVVSSSADSQVTVGNTAPSMSLTNDASNPNGASKTFVMALATTAGNYGLNDGEFLLGGVGNSRGNIVINANYSGTGTKDVVLQPSSGNVGIGTASAAAGGLLTLNRAPAAAFGTPMLQIGGASFTSGGYYSIGLGFTDATYTEPPGEIAFATTSDSGGTSGSIVFGTRSVTTNTAVTERMRIDSSGNVGIGGTANGQRKFEILGFGGTAAGAQALVVTATAPSTATSNVQGVRTTLTTAASLSISEILHFYAAQGTFGAGSSVGTQYGYYVESSLTGATNNYGFYSNIASAANRWNFYAAGTASNYFAGNVGINVSPVSAFKLHVAAATNVTVGIADGTGVAGALTFNAVNNANSANVPLDFRSSATYFSAGIGTTGSAANAYIDNTANNQLLRSTSSLRYKRDVATYARGLSELMTLRAVSFKGISESDGDKTFAGLIAEEVHDAGLTEFVVYDKEGRPDALHYGNMVALLVKAVQELKAELEALKAA